VAEQHFTDADRANLTAVLQHTSAIQQYIKDHSELHQAIQRQFAEMDKRFIDTHARIDKINKVRDKVTYASGVVAGVIFLFGILWRLKVF